MNWCFNFHYDGECFIRVRWLYLLVLVVFYLTGDISTFAGMILATFAVDVERYDPEPETAYAIG